MSETRKDECAECASGGRCANHPECLIPATPPAAETGEPVAFCKGEKCADCGTTTKRPDGSCLLCTARSAWQSLPAAPAPREVSAAMVPYRYDQREDGCWTACLAGLARLPHDSLRAPRAGEVSEEHWPTYEAEIKQELARLGFIHLAFEFKGGERVAPRGFALEFGRSPRGVMHTVIVKDGKLWHDPHPSREGIATHAGYEVLIVRAALSAETGTAP